MLFALRQPAILLGLVLGFAAASMAVGAVQELLVGSTRGARLVKDTRQWLDPYALVAALLAGIGWTVRPEIRRTFRRDPRRSVWLVAVVALVVPGILAAAGIAGYLAAGGSRELLSILGQLGTGSDSLSVLHGSQPIAASFAQRVSLGFGMECLAMSLLSVVPIPPLATGVAVWTQFPRTAGSRRLAYRLLEEQWGVAVILLLVLVPLVSEQPAILALVGTVADDILRALA